jgi:hypothetical protein
MSLPSAVSLPVEMQLGSLDYSLPPEARSYQVKVQPSNISSIVSPDISIAAALEGSDLPFPSTQLIFDIPCGSSPSTFLDNRFTTLNFTATYAVGATTSAVAITSANLRSNANSFFDRMYITSQNGQIVEDITEYALVNDLLINFQMNNSVRDGTAMQFGFDDSASANTSQGHAITTFDGRVAAASETCSFSYSVPILSGLIGALSDKMLNIGRTSKLQLILQTSSVLPVTFVNTTTSNAASSVKVTLANFSITCEYIDIGGSALKMLDQTLVNNQAYIHGISYRVTSNTIPAGTSGNLSLLAGIRNSSVKSLFVKYVDNLTTSLTNGSVNSKFDGKNPSINSWACNIGGMRYPSNSLNPLLQPSQAFSECEKAIGSFNNAQFQSCITRARYCKLARGGTAPADTSTSTDRNYSLSSSATAQCQFFMGYCLEVCAKRGLLSGLNCSSAPVFIEQNLAASCSNAQLIYVIAMIDCIFIHDVSSGDISVRL